MLSTEAMISTGHYLKRVVINIRASKNISGLVKVSVTSPAGLIKFFLNVEPCIHKDIASIFNPSNAEGTFGHEVANIFENYLNPVMLVFIGELSLSTLR